MGSRALLKKARQAQTVFDDLISRFDIKPIPTVFIANPKREAQLTKACFTGNPFPGPFALIMISKRLPGVKKLFRDETVLQTPAIAAVLAACSSVATEIGALRGDDVSGAESYCDVAFAGLQAIRLFMADHKGGAFRMARFKSAAAVNNAINGSFYKYRAGDGRDVSFHVYYQDQQQKLFRAMKMSKPSEQYNFFSIPQDRKEIAEKVSQKPAVELEEMAFDCGACACMIRSREEWEASDLGRAVMAMPLIHEEKEHESEAPDWGRPNSRGPLSGIKVLDLTHIIAGPACSRVLAEYGADVLMIRRGRYMEQEQAMLELDGWAGKNSIQLDFNNPDQLERAKELIKEADVVTYSYQNGTLDRFGLSEADIRALNPNVIYANLNCFSETVWRQRPGWAPCAEDISGLSVRNGSLEKPENLNGVPLDYFPGFILALGTLLAVKHRLQNGGGYKVTTSLTRGAQYLHECSDFCEAGSGGKNSSVDRKHDEPVWSEVRRYVSCADLSGTIGFPGPAVCNTAYLNNLKNLMFSDGNTGWKQR